MYVRELEGSVHVHVGEERELRRVIFPLEQLVLSDSEVNHHCHLSASFSAKLGVSSWLGDILYKYKTNL